MEISVICFSYKMGEIKCVLWYFLFYFMTLVRCDDVLCEIGFCSTYLTETGCGSTSNLCSINNATHTGLLLPSPTTCNCCQYCLPFYGEGEYCSTGGPGTGTTVGRCGDGLTCTDDVEGHSICVRMSTPCFRAQEEYDARELLGEIGSLEHRPQCDGKGKYATHYCIPTMTCFCQSEEGERIFGEALNLGTSTTQSMQCGCSRFHERIKKNISPGVQTPVVGPRCSADGNFNPVQCIDRICYCVDSITGLAQQGSGSVNLDEEPLTELPCYDPDLDLYPQYSEGNPPYNYTTPCLEDMKQKIELILRSEEEGYNVDFASSFPECLPDGTFGRIAFTRTGSKVCIDERGRQIESYEALSSSEDFNNMDCKCASTSYIMGTSLEKPVCCKNGNFRRVQCRRGLCRCVDSDGRQTKTETDDVTKLSCYTEDWRTC